MYELSLQHKKAFLIGLLIECPMGKSLKNCSLNVSRKLPINEQIKLTNEMDEDQLTQILNKHRNCLREREN